MNVFSNTFVVLVVNAIARFTTDMQGRVRIGTAAGRDIGCRAGTAFLHKVGAAGLFTSTGTGACYFDVRAAAAFSAVVGAGCDGTF